MITSFLTKHNNDKLYKMHLLNEAFNRLLIFISWFGLILCTSLYSRFNYYDININYIKLCILLSLLVGLYVVFINKAIKLNSNVLIAIFIIYFLAFVSDPSKVAVISYSAFYCFLIHYLSINRYQLIVKQYLFTCKLIAFFAFVDFLSFNLFGDFIIGFREPAYGLCVNVYWCQYFPQIMTIFDEGSHMVFYLLPSFMYYLKFFLEKNTLPLSLLTIFLAIVSTLSATGAIVIIFSAFLYTLKVRRQYFKKILVVLSFITIVYIFSESYLFKFQNIFMNSNDWLIDGISETSSLPYRIVFDVLDSASIISYLFGHGLYNVDEALIKFLDDPNMMNYYISTGILDHYPNLYENNTGSGWGGFGLVRLVFGYGIILLLIIISLLYRSRAYNTSSNIGFAAIFTVFLLLLKITSTIELPMAIFFIFGLFEYKSNVIFKK